MFTMRNALIAACVCSAMVLPVSDAFARGGGGGRSSGGGGGGRSSGGGGGGRTGGQQQQVQQENPTITADRQQVTVLTATFTAAGAAYTNAVKKFTDDFIKQPEYADAQKAVDEAQKAVDAARTAVIQKLKETSTEYRAAVAKEADTRKKLDALRANGGNRDQINTLSQAILDSSDAITKLENDALAKDKPYQEAKIKLADATGKLKEQKDRLAEALKADTSIADLKTKRDTAQTDLDAARKKLTQDLATLQ